MNVFDFVNAINYDKRDLFDDVQADKDYAPFIVNRSLSYFPDTVLYANVMNGRGHLSKKMQFEFLKNSIPKKKRYSKWVKKEVASDDLTAVCRFYKYSVEKALEVISILSSEQINFIKQSMETGGKS